MAREEGIQADLTYGETNGFRYNIVDKPVHVQDLQATLFHLMGLDHERLTYRFQDRDHRLTDVHGEVVRSILS